MECHQARRVALFAIMVAVVAAVAGCAANRQPRSSVPQAVQAARSVLNRNVEWLRQDWYRTDAEYQLAAQCMKRRGFKYVTPDMGPEPGPNTMTTFALGTGHPATYGVTLETFADPPDEPDWRRPGFGVALDGRSTLMASVTIPVVGGSPTKRADAPRPPARSCTGASARTSRPSTCRRSKQAVSRNSPAPTRPTCPR